MSYLTNGITDPRVWIGGGASAVCFGLALGYVEEQRVAADVLAQKEMMPAPVLVQSFEAGRHANEMSEANVIGEADFGAAQVVEPEATMRFLVVPISNVSSGGRHAAIQRMVEIMGRGMAVPPHRPVPRPTAPTVG
ncbi:MAG: hypothetical protein AAF762_03810, partial [Pseudomonadota bacterium]